MARPVVLCILDGWGHSDATSHNAIAGANTPCWDEISSSSPHTLLKTSGLAVGLPDGQMGNSEVGHMNIGSGRIVMQSLPKIDQAIEDGSLEQNTLLQDAIQTLKDSGGTCHILGLLSPGGVHAHQYHMAALAKMVGRTEIPVKIHAFTDGRDTPPNSAREYIGTFEKYISNAPSVSIASLCGRYFAMDRDNRWERVKKSYDAIITGTGTRVESATDAINHAYDAGVTDEFIEPYVMQDYKGVKDGDVIIMANFRADRARQILTALLDPEFKEFERPDIRLAKAIGMVEYSKQHNAFIDTLFPQEEMKDTLGAIIADKGDKQLRIAETEKYAHVTFFFNGGIENAFKGEDRILVPSPKVATYDLKPEMSAFEVTDKLVEAINSDKYGLIVANYANTDMVGHTGNYDAAVKAVEAVDTCLCRLSDAINGAGGVMLVTADHGNAESMIDENDQPNTQHTTGPVPLVMTGNYPKGLSLKEGRLCDIAPTILQLMDIDQPNAMSGESLIA